MILVYCNLCHLSEQDKSRSIGYILCYSVKTEHYMDRPIWYILVNIHNKIMLVTAIDSYVIIIM